jgi:Cofilin/tropomyosin-type actin-binding protein
LCTHTKAPMIAGTMQTDPRSGGVKRSSGVNVLPAVVEAWSEVRDDANKDVDWILVGYDGNSKTDMTLVEKGNGGMDAVSGKLQEGVPLFGGVRLSKGRFVHFLYVDEACPAMKKGRTLMYKNGVFNVLEGCDGEIEMSPGLTEATMGPIR